MGFGSRGGDYGGGGWEGCGGGGEEVGGEGDRGDGDFPAGLDGHCGGWLGWGKGR